MMTKTHKGKVRSDFAPEGFMWRLEMEAQRIVRAFPRPGEAPARQ